MPDPFTIAIAGYIAANAPHWLDDLRKTLFSKGKEFALKKGEEWLSEKEQQLRLQQILEKAVQRGLARFQTLEQRDQYRDILANLFEPGAHSDTLRREAITLFSLSDTPNLAELNEAYNRSLRTRHLSAATPPAEVDAAPYLISFFDALAVELYADSFFKGQIGDVIQTRAALTMPQQMTEANLTLREIREAIRDDYKEEQYQQDIARYAAFLDQTFHTLKIIGVVPKDQNPDPELNGIFVPLRIAMTDQTRVQEKQESALVALLKQFSRLVLLGAPGSGKSTAIRHLTWSHAKASLAPSEIADVPLLPGHPLPLRIELRLLMQDRKHRPDYSFLSYATEVLLGREGIKINPLMFEKLLAQKRLLVLFDGLDEVATLEERQRLVQEIEHFATLYPNNYLLVTSRPVGYEQASCSKQLFTQGQVQPFDDDQIHQFLERWYTYVLRLEPLPYQEQQELETLFTTLKENTRLHKLAENPLLLTVITALYRSQRLPEKRVQVYDKCAELLLEIWAKLKGTDERWRGMKIGKDDQFACVAHLGFQLHQHAQEQSVSSRQEAATDVPVRFMLREIEHFLSSRKLLTEVAEQHKEARQFLELMQVEAGLIVERGTDENGESIYGFVHRTFQEYFAASDVYERYRQDEDPAIIRDFLVEHLHDPHWREVTLLLLAKLGRKPLTVRLRQLLEGKIKSHRSCYRDIVQQDLFFICDCMIEEMAIENDLAEIVIADLARLVTTSPFSSQREEALEKLGALIQTKEFTSLARSKLIGLMTLDTLTDTDLKIQVSSTLYRYSPADSEEEHQAIQTLLRLAQHPDLAIEQGIQAAQALYESSPTDSEEGQQAAQILLQLAQRADLAIEQTIRAAQALYGSSRPDSEEEQQARQVLLQLAQRADLAIEQAIQAAQALYESSRPDSEEGQQAAQILLQLAQCADLPIEQRIQAILAIQELQVVQALYRNNPADSEEGQQATLILLQLAQCADLPIEQRIQAAQALYGSIPANSGAERQATEILLQFAQRADLAIEQTIRAAQALYGSTPTDSEEGQQATLMLLQLAQRADLAIEQAIQAAQALYESSPVDSKERQLATQMLWQLAQDVRVTADQRLSIIATPIETWNASYSDRTHSVQTLSTLLPREKATSYLEEHWILASGDTKPTEIPYVVELTRQELLPPRARDNMYSRLRSSVSQFSKISPCP